MFIRHRQPTRISGKLLHMNTESLVSALGEFLNGGSSAVVIEDNSQLFDLAQAKYSVSGESDRCLLHLWSSERNVVRRVLEVESRGDTLRVTVQRIGHAKPSGERLPRRSKRGSFIGTFWNEPCGVNFPISVWCN